MSDNTLDDLPLDDDARRFIAAHPHAAIVTVGADGRPKVVKIEVALLDGRLTSAGHADKVRSRRLRTDPRCTLYFADDEHGIILQRSHYQRGDQTLDSNES